MSDINTLYIGDHKYTLEEFKSLTEEKKKELLEKIIKKTKASDILRHGMILPYLVHRGRPVERGEIFKEIRELAVDYKLKVLEDTEYIKKSTKDGKTFYEATLEGIEYVKAWIPWLVE